MSETTTIRKKPAAAAPPAGGGAVAAPAIATATHAAAPSWASARSTAPFGFGSGLVQCSVVIGPPNDRYEREADQVATTVAGGQSHPAERISRLPESGEKKMSRAAETEKKESTTSVQRAEQGEIEEQRQPIAGPAADEIRDAKPLVQRMCAECGREMGADHSGSAVQRVCAECSHESHSDHSEPAVQRRCEGEEGGPDDTSSSVRRKADDSKSEAAVQKSGPAASASGMQTVAAHAVSSKGPGSPLPPSVRSTMESRMGASFAGVRVHSDNAAQDAAAALHARAFTNRADIWLGRGQSSTNLSLMAHELTHVVQQGAAPARASSSVGVQRAADKEEHQPVQRAADDKKSEASVQRAIVDDNKEKPIQRANEEKKEQAVQRAEEKKSEASVQRAASEEHKAEPVQRAEATGHSEEKPVQRATIGEVQRAASEGSKEETKVQRASGGVVQRDGWLSNLASGAGAVWDATGRKLVDAAGKAIEIGEELFWKALRLSAPGIAQILEDISKAGGIFNYVKNKVFDVARSIFKGIGGDKGFLKDLLDKFGKLHESAAKIFEALKHNDCQPLFDAFNRLADMASELAGKAWDKIKEFFKPIGDFFTGIWDKYISKAMDKISDLAGEAWQGIKDFFQSIWDSTKDFRAAIGSAWDWLKKKIGIGSGPEGENKDGILQWASKKIGEAWDWVKKQMEPVTKPMMAVVAKVNAIIPLDKILHLRQTVHDWLGSVKKMMTNLQKKEDVVQNQDVLRKEILPAIKMRILQLKGKVVEAGAWVTGEVAGAAQTVNSFLGGLRSNSILSLVSGAFDWIESKVKDLANWANDKVQGVFGYFAKGLDRFAGFVEPVYDTLEKVVSILGNIVGKLSDLVFGKFWNAIPQCIRDPIRDWIIENVLKQIPILSTLLEAKDLWPKVKAFAIDLLKTLFVKGDLAGAAYKVAEFVLKLAGVDVDLMLHVIAKAADRLDEIIMEPGKFLSNVGAAFWKGLEKFKDNIVVHLANGLISWLVGPSMSKLGITGLKDLSLGSILDLVLQILGINWGKIRSKIEKLVGPQAFKILDHAYRLLKAIWDGGPAGLWEEIKSQLGELKSMVIGGITQWITKEVIEAGIAFLIKLSNPVGAILQVIQAVYKIIKTVIEKANQIMQVVDSVLDGIGDIISGAIDGAATMVEKALGRAVPVAITFVANLLNLGDPSPTVSGIIKKVQDKVDKALDWLVQKIKDLAMKIGGAIKSAVGAVAGLIFPKETFDAEGETHTIDVNQSEEGDPILIHSQEVHLEELIDEAIKNEIKGAEKLKAAYEKYLKLPVPKVNIKDKEQVKDDKTWNAVQKQGEVKISAFEKDVVPLIKSVLPAVFSLKKGPAKTQIVFGPENKDLGGTMMVAHPLAYDAWETGTSPDDDKPPIMDPKMEKKNWKIKPARRGLYKRGHLLNQHLGGTGQDARNLTPLTTSANSYHLHRAESDVKEAFEGKDGKQRVMHYEVHVNYPGGRSLPKGSNADPAEADFAVSLSTKWYELVPKNPPKDYKPWEPGEATIPNVEPYP